MSRAQRAGRTPTTAFLTEGIGGPVKPGPPCEAKAYCA
ncbi:hypothetical protein AB691_0298 [Stutzerimonas stutzeri]|nr:hypothetical protein AB691_0298 [Stutzerimonas stutzeri]